MTFPSHRALVFLATGIPLAWLFACSKEETPPHLVVEIPDAGETTPDATTQVLPDATPDATQPVDAADDGYTVQKLAQCKDLSNSVTYIQICKDLSTLIGRDVPNAVLCPEGSRSDALLAGCVYDDTPPDAGDGDSGTPDADAGRTGNLCCPPNVKGGML